MGNLLGGVSFREPTTVEDCDSTWQTDSEPEPELEEPGPGGGGEGPGREPEPPAQPPERPRASPAPDEDAEAAGAEQVRGPAVASGWAGARVPRRREDAAGAAPACPLRAEGRAPGGCSPSAPAAVLLPRARGPRGPGVPASGLTAGATRKSLQEEPNLNGCFLCLCRQLGDAKVGWEEPV